jgi:hypothetical protein
MSMSVCVCVFVCVSVLVCLCVRVVFRCVARLFGWLGFELAGWASSSPGCVFVRTCLGVFVWEAGLRARRQGFELAWVCVCSDVSGSVCLGGWASSSPAGLRARLGVCLFGRVWACLFGRLGFELAGWASSSPVL